MRVNDEKKVGDVSFGVDLQKHLQTYNFQKVKDSCWNPKTTIRFFAESVQGLCWAMQVAVRLRVADVGVYKRI